MKSASRSSLAELAQRFFPEAIVADASSACGEKGKRFAIAKERSESVVACDLKGWRAPVGQKTCDCVFLGAAPGKPELMLALVELKGKRVDTALEQIEATFKLLCRKYPPDHPEIGHAKSASCKKAPGVDGCKHTLYTLGVIVAPGGGREFDRRFNARARLLNDYGLKILLVNSAQVVCELSDLFKEANSKNP